MIQGPREQCAACSDPLPIPTPETVITAGGGWCAPTDLLYAMELSRVCGACLAAMAIGVPRHVMDGLLKVKRGGVTFNTGVRKT